MFGARQLVTAGHELRSPFLRAGQAAGAPLETPQLGVLCDAPREVLCSPSSASQGPSTSAPTPVPERAFYGGRDFPRAPAAHEQPPALMWLVGLAVVTPGATNQEINPPCSCLHPHLHTLPITAAQLQLSMADGWGRVVTLGCLHYHH